jgi:hypothetical protein
MSLFGTATVTEDAAVVSQVLLLGAGSSKN